MTITRRFIAARAHSAAAVSATAAVTTSSSAEAATRWSTCMSYYDVETCCWYAYSAPYNVCSFNWGDAHR